MNIRRSRTLSKQSSLFVRRKREQNIIKWIIASVLIILIIFVTSYIVNIKAINISSVEIYGVDNEDSILIRQKINQLLDGKYLGLFSKTNAFIYPKEKVAALVQSIDPSIKDVDIGLKNKRILTISIREKAADAIVCIGLPDFEESSEKEEKDCYFVDQKGSIFAQAPIFSGSAYKRYYVPDIAATSTYIGVNFISEKDFKDLQMVYDTVREAAINSEGILIKPEGQFELYIDNPNKIESDTSPTTAVVYFDQNSGLNDQLQNLISFWRNQFSKSLASGPTLEFDSIDVRYIPNVFYRLKNQ